MSESKPRQSGDPVQFPEYIFSDVRDGQYRGFVPPAQNQEPWGMSPTNYMFNMPGPEGQMNLSTQSPFDFTQSNQVFHDQYEKHLNENDLFSMHLHPNINTTMSMPDVNMYSSDFKYPIHNVYPSVDNGYLEMNGVFNSPPPVQNRSHSNRTPILENVLGNWTPNTSGTYSPFGNVATSNITNIFDTKNDVNCLPNHDVKNQSEKANEDLLNFQFTRDTKKPRIIAEVKPMRPTYSDVLLKSVPNNNTKPGKIDIKDIKQKKETKKNIKNDKSQKGNGLNRSNTNNEFKDIPTEKNHVSKNNERNTREAKSGQLNRKWVSLDNVSETFNHTVEEIKEKKIDDNRHVQKSIQRKPAKSNVEHLDTDSGATKNDSYTLSRSTIKKNKSASKQKHTISTSPEQQNNRRGQRGKKRGCQLPFDIYRQRIIIYLKNWWKFCIGFIFWLFTLVSDICSLSWQIWRDSLSHMWTWISTHWTMFREATTYVIKRVRFFTWIYEKFKKPKDKDEKRTFVRAGLQYNINMPQTGDEAMKRLLACKGKDPYSILGLTSTCTDDDIKKYYKKQAVLVHPDKNKQPGAEEAFKILVHAFDMIGEPERRAAYDRGVAESAQVEQAWTELTELLAQFQQKVEAAAKTIRCSYCGAGHKRTKIERPIYAARNCNTCKIFHAAREGDIWAESTCFGLLWNYYACMDGGVYDITEWAGCQKNSLKQLKPDSHNVQYRIALGKSSTGCRKHSTGRHPSPHQDDPTNLENLLNKFYGQNESSQNRRKNNKKKFK